MVYLNEWLPNPVGNDNAGEFAELFNDGKQSVSLKGWALATDKKKFSLAGYSVPANGYLVLKTSKTKLALKNTDGVLSLYGPGGKIADSANFLGTAQEGKSYGRIFYGGGDYGASPQAFTWGDPTPGAKNKAVKNAIAERNYPLGIPLNDHLAAPQFLELMFGAAIVLTGLFIYVTKKNEHLSNLFLEGNKRPGK